MADDNMVNRVDANPVMIKWARMESGLSLDELPKSLANAKKWETGELKPTWADLRNLAKKYKRPSYFYFLSEPPKVDDDLIEFRSEREFENYSYELRLEIRKAKFRRHAVIKIYNDLNKGLDDFSRFVNFEKNPMKLAQHIRNYLNISFETQQKWILKDNGKRDQMYNSFLLHWKEICFDLGILVFEMEKVSEKEISGCSLYYDNYPIILLNGKNNPNRRIFTLMHELAHLTQETSAICDVDKNNVKEAFCNKVATEILIPQETFDTVELFTKKGDLKLSYLANLYGISKQSLVYKLNSSKLIDDVKNNFINEIELKNRNKTQKDIGRSKNSNQRIPTYIKKKKYDGTQFIKLILVAYENNIITAPQAVRYLDTSFDNFEKINNEILR